VSREPADTDRGPLLSRVAALFEDVARDPWARFGFFSLLALLAVWPTFETAASLNEFRDAHVLQAYERDAWTSVTRFAQLPLWDPYYCGGMYALGTPQSRFAAPPFLLTLLLGPLRAQPVIACTMLVLGMEGAFRYFRRRARSSLGPALAAPLIALNGMFAVAYFNGWINFYGFELVPWVLFGASLAASGDARGVLVTALAFAFIVGFGGTYAAPMAALFALLETLRTALERRSEIRRALPVIFAAGALSAGASAFRLWPVWETLASAPRIMAGTPSTDWQQVERALLEPAIASGGNHGWDGVYYTRAIALLIAPVALFAPRAIPAALLGGLSLWAALGYSGTTPFSWLRELPIFSTFRYPERFLFFACLFATELCAVGVALLLRVRFGVLRVLFALGAFGVFGWSYATLIENHRGAVGGMQLSRLERAPGGEFHQARGNRWLAAHYGPQNRGSLSCWEAYPVPQSEKLRGDLISEEYLADPEAGSVERVAWSPNRIDLSAQLERPTRLIVNQNWHPGWRSNVGEVVSHDGLLAVDLPAQRSELRLRFLPRSALGGALISFASLLTAGAFWALRRGRLRSRSRLFALAPLGALALALSIPEPPHPPPTYTNADGTPALVDAVPADALPLDVGFELPVELVAARARASPGRIDVELYWRVGGRVPRSVGVSAQFEAPGRHPVVADHLAVASSFYLSDAPRGRIVRDAFSVRPPAALDAGWTLWVGLQHVTANGEMIAPASPGRAELAENRLKIPVEGR
jgi:NAD(P)-dependent dehydrogenase (short-subunit alcohol dehydrogenase family)